jgi:hypothetical protein
MKLHVRCKTSDEPSVVFIMWKGEQIGVCARCWTRIAEKDWETGNSPKLTMEELLSDKARFGENPVETEYKLRGMKNAKGTESEEEEIE